MLDGWSVALFSSRGPAFVAVEKLKAQGFSTEDAITQVVGERVDGKAAGGAAVEAQDAGTTKSPEGSGTAEAAA